MSKQTKRMSKLHRPTAISKRPKFRKQCQYPRNELYTTENDVNTGETMSKQGDLDDARKITAV